MSPRLAAVEAGAVKYYSGKPCSKGHDSLRYTRNGACCECMTLNNAQIQEKMNLQPNAVKAARGELVEMGVRIFHSDVGPMLEAAVALTVARYPVLTRPDVVGKAAPTAVASGTGWYKLRVHPADVEMLQQVAAAYRSAHKPEINLSPVWNRLQAAVKQEEARDTGAGEWTFK